MRALASMSGLTSQPNLNSLVAALRNTPRDSGLDLDSLNSLADYWETVREQYYPFEENLKAGTAHVYHHEMPGGQYTNLRQQAKSLGLEDRWNQIADAYAAGQRTLRRHRESHPLQQSRRRHGPVHGDQWPVRPGCPESRTRNSISPKAWWR